MRLWPESATRRIERSHGIPDGAIGREAFDRELVVRAILGELTDEAWRAAVAGRLSQKYGAGTTAAVREWSQLTGVVDWDMLQVVRELRRTVPALLLTNATSALYAQLERLDLLREFDEVVSSHETGVAKPEPRAYLSAAERAGVDPESCVMIDDRQSNVDGAVAVGMAGIRHVGASATRAALRSFGLLLPD